jgi:hypothetical protein
MTRAFLTAVLSVTALGSALFLASPAPADGGDGGCGKRGGRWHGPPQVAFDACAEAAEGTPCTFTGRRGREIAGTCAPIGDGLACVPEHRRRGSGERLGDEPRG